MEAASWDATAEPGDLAAGALDGTYGEQTGLLLKVHGGGAHPGTVPEGFDDLYSHMLDAAPRARLSEEERLEREVARRRQQDIERRARIFDAKRRTIGVDKEMLDRQVAEAEERRRLERERARIEDRELLGVNKVLQMVENENRKKRHDAEKETKAYSLQHLNFQSRREFDLNDKKAVITGIPQRIGDDDPRCGPASMQQFNGEDLLKHERDAQQKLAFAHTLEQQIFEKGMLSRMGAGGDAAYAQQCQDVINLRNEVEAGEAAYRKELMAKYQKSLKDKMQDTTDKKQDECMHNQEMNQRELDFHARDEFLNETRNNYRPDGKLSKDSYKGSTREQRVEVFGDQLRQCEENADRRASEGSCDFGQQRAAELTRKQLVMMEREKQRMKKAMAMEVAAHNQGMLQKQQDTKQLMGRDAHRNNIRPDFFEQFGVGTR